MRVCHRLVVGLAAAQLCVVGPLAAQDGPDRSRDRGDGIPVSMFGTYVRAGEWLVYPFFEYYRDGDAEYSPDELGYGLDEDYRGNYRGKEVLLFLGYGISDRLAFEAEAAWISARLETDPADPTDTPDALEESGIGDVEGQLRWRWNRESDSRPEFFTYVETVLPLQKSKRLIGTRDWEFKLGSGFVRGFGWATLTVRAAVEYDGGEKNVALGEYAVEVLRRVSPRLRLFGAVEGSEDEVELITEVQWFLRPDLFLKLNNALGVTSKATDWAPEIGLMFSFR